MITWATIVSFQRLLNENHLDQYLAKIGRAQWQWLVLSSTNLQGSESRTQKDETTWFRVPKRVRSLICYTRQASVISTQMYFRILCINQQPSNKNVCPIAIWVGSCRSAPCRLIPPWQILWAHSHQSKKGDQTSPLKFSRKLLKEGEPCGS